MYAVIFQVEPKTGRATDFDIAATLRAELDKIDGFISIEQFESVAQPGSRVSLSFWRDEAAILAWRTHVGHQHAQGKGRGEIFNNYRLRPRERRAGLWHAGPRRSARACRRDVGRGFPLLTATLRLAVKNSALRY